MFKIKAAEFVQKYRYSVIIFVLGLILLFPWESFSKKDEDIPNNPLQDILSLSDGAGKTLIIISENGAVIVSEGADNAAVKLNILNAVRAYTGFGTDKIVVLKMH